MMQGVVVDLSWASVIFTPPNTLSSACEEHE